MGLGVEKRLCRATVGAETGSQAITQTARRAKSVLHRTLTLASNSLNPRWRITSVARVRWAAAASQPRVRNRAELT